MENPLPRRAAANPTQYNINAIAKLEHDALDRRTPTERVSDVFYTTRRQYRISPGSFDSDLRLEPGKSARDFRTQSI